MLMSYLLHGCRVGWNGLHHPELPISTQPELMHMYSEDLRATHPACSLSCYLDVLSLTISGSHLSFQKDLLFIWRTWWKCQHESSNTHTNFNTLRIMTVHYFHMGRKEQSYFMRTSKPLGEVLPTSKKTGVP